MKEQFLNYLMIVIVASSPWWIVGAYKLFHAFVEFLKSNAQKQWAKDALDFLDGLVKIKVEALQATARKRIEQDLADGRITEEEAAASRAALMAEAVKSVKDSGKDAIKVLQEKYGLQDIDIEKILRDLGEGKLEAVKTYIKKNSSSDMPSTSAQAIQP